MNAEPIREPSPAEPAAAPVPVAASERITAIDTLRGVAVLGILVMNIYAFAMPVAAYENPLVMGGEEWYNLGTWFFTYLFFDQKFLTIFSLLFGGGIIIMWQRAEARGAGFGALFFRRQFWLLMFGAIHGYLIWFGDILFHYALVGMCVYFFRRAEPATLILLACLLLPVAPLYSYGGAVYMEELRSRALEIGERLDAGEKVSDEEIATKEEWDSLAPLVAPTDLTIREDLDSYRGDYADTLAFRAPMVLDMQTQSIPAFVLWRVGGLMLLGMALMKLGILSGLRSTAFYRRMLIAGYGLGLPIVLFGAVDLYAHRFDGIYMFRVGMLPNYFGSVMVAFGHIAAVMLIGRRGIFPALMQRFNAVGRMALSNYLMHSLVMTTLFYGYGLSLYGEIPRLAQMAFVAGLIGFQLWLSPVWLSRYRFGPLEWLWRSLTYRHPQPMRGAG